MDKECCSGNKTLIFACSGGSNVGQLSNEAARQLDQEGLGTMFCLAGLGGDVQGIIDNTRSADNVVVIDGCGVACAKLACERHGVPVSSYVVATDCGIEKGHHFSLTQEQVAAVCGAVRQAVG